MSTERLWKQLTDNKLPWPATHLAQSCEEELKELMTQIDRMIQSKQRDWENDTEALKTRLRMKDQENDTLQRSCVELRREVAQCRRRVEEVEMSKSARLAEYEAQVGYLRQEVTNMTAQYERQRRKLDKQTRKVERERERVEGGGDRRVEELERQLVILQQRNDAAERNAQGLEEKNAFLQSQFKSYQEQLERRKRMLEESEVGFQAKMAHLEEQLRMTRENLAHQTGLVEKLKRTQDETAASYKKAMDERELLDRDMRSSRQSILRLEEEARRLSGDLARKEKNLVRAESDLKVKLEELSDAQETIRKKSEALSAMEAARGEEEELRKKGEELEETLEVLKEKKRSEKRLQDELGIANRRIADLEKYNTQIVERLQRAKEDISKVQSYEMSTMKEEWKRSPASEFPSPTVSFYELVKPSNGKARDALVSAEETHAEQISRIRRTQQESDEQIASLQRREADTSERLKAAERRAKITQDSSERLSAELHVANAQVEALRLENRHLRGFSSPSESVLPSRPVDKRPAPAYTALRGSVTLEKTADQEKPPPAPENTHEEKHEKSRGDELQRQVELLTSDKMALSRELEQQVETLRRLSLENKAMASFVSGVSMALSTTPAEAKRAGPAGDTDVLLRQLNNNASPMDSKGRVEDEVESLRSLLRATSMSRLDVVSQSTDPTVSRFLAEERERSLELEHLINSHIEELKLETEKTLSDYKRDILNS